MKMDKIMIDIATDAHGHNECSYKNPEFPVMGYGFEHFCVFSNIWYLDNFQDFSTLENIFFYIY